MKENIRLEDGRKGERHIIDETGEDGSVKRTIEIYAEPKIEKKLSHRVVEYTRPTVFKREIEQVNEATGEIERRIESVEPNVKMELREHIVETPVSAQSQSEMVTRDELKELLLALKSSPNVSALSVESPEAVVPAQQIVKERQESKGLFSNNYVKYPVLITVIVGQLVGLYFLFT